MIVMTVSLVEMAIVGAEVEDIMEVGKREALMDRMAMVLTEEVEAFLTFLPFH